MKARRIVVLMAMLGVIGTAAGAQMSEKERLLRKEWSERYGTLSGALMKKDSKTVRQMVAPEAVWLLTGSRKQSLAQIQAELDRKLDAIKPNIQFTLNITKLNVSDKEATIERTQVIAGFYKDAQGKRHQAFDGSGWEDVWTKTGQGWKLKRAKQFNETRTIDGRPGDPFAAAPKK